MTRFVCTTTLCTAALLMNAAPALAASAVNEEVVVTALKHGDSDAQTTSVSIEHFGTADLETRHVENLTDLNFAMANVQIEDLGTARGIANISIRGVGVNSSISSVDPAVGVFTDGLYVGMNAGTLTHLFDVNSVEVLRGPQGALYGHNVTGGAVVLTTRAPTDDFEANAKLAVESGPNVIAEGAVSGPLLPGLLSARLALLGTHDSGWFTNKYDNSQFGENSTRAARLSLALTPAPNFEAVLRLEYGHDVGDGPAGQNHALFQRGTFDFSINNPGFVSNQWQSATLEADWHVGLGGGTITSISGIRSTDVRWGADIDSTPVWVFHTRIANIERQRSEELRYAGTFGDVDVVGGLYFQDQNLLYLDERNFGPSFRRTGGGEGYFRDLAAFANADWHLTGTLTLGGGLRYTHEAKNSHISRVRAASDNLNGSEVIPGEGVAGGDMDAHTLNFSDTPFFQKWDDLSPSARLSWQPDANTNLYALWSRGFRGGGANFRTSSLGLAPLSYDPETESSFEIGWKQRFGEGFVHAALFHNRIANMQRETNLADPISGVQQVVLNAGNAVLFGGDLEAGWQATEQLMLSANFGYVRGYYTRVTQDLNGDLAVNAVDQAMRIPRLAPLNYGASAEYRLPLPGGDVAVRLAYSHRDASFYNDSNLGRLAETDRIDAGVTFTPATGGWSLSLYGKNLADVATWGGDTTLPSSSAFGYSGGARPTFSPLNKGRVIGIALRLEQ